MAKPVTSPHPTIVPDDDAPGRTGTYRLHEDSRGMVLLTQVREAEPGSDVEKELAHKLSKLDDIHEVVTAAKTVVDQVSILISGAGKTGRGVKVIGALLAAAITANPVIGSLVTPDNGISEQLDILIKDSNTAKIERRGLAKWQWQLKQCADEQAKAVPDPSKIRQYCVDEPPPPVRVILAQDAMETHQ